MICDIFAFVSLFNNLLFILISKRQQAHANNLGHYTHTPPCRGWDPFVWDKDVLVIPFYCVFRLLWDFVWQVFLALEISYLEDVFIASQVPEHWLKCCVILNCCVYDEDWKDEFRALIHGHTSGICKLP